MNRIAKRAGALLMALLMLTGICIPASAADSKANADHLNALGLFQGTGDGYDLEGTATRIQGLIMMIRLLGEEDQALAADPAKSPFTDVADWAKPYTSYGYEKGYAAGRSETSFDPDGALDFKSYTTFMLRALDYDDQAGDFAWATAPQKAAEIGMMDSASATAVSAEPTFYRADMVDISYATLTMNMKTGGITLAQKLINNGVFTEAQAKAEGVLSGPVKYQYVVKDNSTVSRETKTYAVASGNVTANVITVNMANPKVRVKTAMVNDRIGATDSFANIVKNTNAKVVVNANYFESYKSFQRPIGHFMSNGNFLFGNSGMTSMGFTDSGEIRVGVESVVFNVYVNGQLYWDCNELNIDAQGYYSYLGYTPAFGDSVPITHDATVITVSNGTITGVEQMANGSSAAIPADGFVMVFGPDYTSKTWYKQPQVGMTNVTLKPEKGMGTAEFDLNGITNMVSGGPRLVKGGQQYTVMDAGFEDQSRFGPTARNPRTAVGKTADGKLVIVSTGGATIQQMRELMLQLDCVDALCLDGGASTALAYDGAVITSPGRYLTTTLQVFVD